MDTNESILRKIRALLAKTQGQGCTAEEASAAAEKAKQLLDEHNLSLSEIDPGQFKSSVEKLDIELNYDRIPLWMKHLGNYIAKAFDCKMIAYSGQKIQFIGLKSDVETTAYFFVRLMIDFKIEAERQHALSAAYSKRVWVSNFIIFAAKAVHDRLKLLKTKPQTTALIIVKADLINKFLEANDITFRSGQGSSAQQDSSGANAGYKYGQTVELNKKLTNE